jgi:hypothetical protein
MENGKWLFVKIGWRFKSTGPQSAVSRSASAVLAASLGGFCNCSGRQKGRKHFFFEKKKQKTFASLSRTHDQRA